MPERPAFTRALVPPNSRRAELAKRVLPPASRRRIAAKNLFDAATGKVALREALADSTPSPSARLRRFLATNRPTPDPGPRRRGVHVVGTDTSRFAAGELPPGDLVTFVAPGDVHEPELIGILARTDESVDLISWDDVTHDGTGAPSDPRVRPVWSPDTHLVAPYLHRAFAVRAGAVADSGWEPTGPGVTAVDLWRLVDTVDPAPNRTLRLPWFLSRCPSRTDRLPATVVREGLARRGIAAEPDPDGLRLRFRRPSGGDRPTVTIVVPTRHNRAEMSRLLPALAATAGPGVDLVVVDNGGESPENASWYRDQPFADRTTVDWWTAPFNWSAVNNHGARLGSGEILVFCNDDALPLRADWLDDLCGWLSVPGVGSAGPVIVSSDGRVGEAGIAAGLADLCEHLLRGADPRGSEMIGPVGWPRDVIAVTGACVAVTRETFEAVGGFDEGFEITGSDVAFGVAVVEHGLRNVCTGLASIRHDEMTTRRRGADDPADVSRLRDRLEPYMDVDPVVSAQLSRWHARPRLATAAEQAARRSDEARAKRARSAT